MNLNNTNAYVKSNLAKIKALTTQTERSNIFTIQKWSQMLNTIKIQALYTTRRGFNI